MHPGRGGDAEAAVRDGEGAVRDADEDAEGDGEVLWVLPPLPGPDVHDGRAERNAHYDGASAISRLGLAAMSDVYPFAFDSIMYMLFQYSFNVLAYVARW